MKKEGEKHPIDGLFAKKLRDTSVPPAADGFARLQARMGKAERKSFLTVWQNPTVMRYAAAAACSLLISVLGWKVWEYDESKTSNPTTVAVNESAHAPIKIGSTEKDNQKDQREAATPAGSKTYVDTTPQLAQPTTASSQKIMFPDPIKNEQLDQLATGSTNSRQLAIHTIPSGRQETAAGENQVNGIETKSVATPVVENPAPVVPPIKPQPVVAQVSAKPEKAPERVLVVTIAEPPALAAARQAVTDANAQPVEKPIVAQVEKSEKEAKPATLWQQLRRVREGDVFARRADGDDTDRGLFERAYRGVKHSIETNKAQKND